jgi:hypothetical protein
MLAHNIIIVGIKEEVRENTNIGESEHDWQNVLVSWIDELYSQVINARGIIGN